MVLNRVKKIALFALLMYLPFCSMAWGVQGHRIVGQIADAYLSKKAKKEIFNILGTESVAMAANWADFIKSDPAYAYIYSWHYVNLQQGLGADQVKTFLAADTATDAYTKINWLAAQLKNNNLSHDNKAMYLKLLIHIVGDVHQPMHVGHLGDKGGNDIKLTWFNNPANLHQVWDERLIDFQQLSYTEYTAAINFTSKDQRMQWQAEPLSEWIWQSYQQAEKIYADIKPDDKLSYQYNYKYVATLNLQLLKGGVHLAGLLNQIFE